MSSRDAWQRLGLEPTDDATKIRRAYATALKAIDVDADPDAFIALRAARERALADAQRVANAVVDDVSHEDPKVVGGKSPSITGADNVGFDECCNDDVDCDIDAQRDFPASDQADDDQTVLVEHQEALIALLLPGGDAQMLSPDLEETEAILAHFDALAEDPELARIELFSQASEWFARLIAQSSPRSDMLIEPARAIFGWSRDSDIGSSPAIAFVRDRWAAIVYRSALLSRRHRLHRAWKELSRPATEHSRRGWVGREKVRELLDIIRLRYPTLEGELDWYRVQLWENEQAQVISKGQITLVLLFLISIARLAFSVDQPATRAPDVPMAIKDGQLADAVSDIDVALRGRFGDSLNAGRLQIDNPSLFALLRTNWQLAQEQGVSRDTFAMNVGEVLTNYVNAAMATAAPALQRRALELRLERVRAARAEGWDSCVAAAKDANTPAIDMGDEWRVKERQLAVEALATASTADGDVRTTALPPSTFTVSGRVVQRMLDQTGFSRGALEEGMLNKGSMRQRCLVKLALLKAAMDEPGREGRTLRRNIAGGF